jgi:plastocyanin
MSRTILALGAAMVVILSACGGGATASAPATAAPASAPAASESAAGGAPCAPSSEAGTVTGTMANIAFDPTSITASVGDTITWTNNDTAQHTATVKSDPACTTETLANGASGGIVFNTAGSYEFFCKIHPNMTGTIEVS